MNKSYWISWTALEPLHTFELHSPWWVSGYNAYDNPTIVAAVRAPSPEAAVEVVRNAYDSPPPIIDLRFCDEMPAGRSPFSDRFPKCEWMAWDGDATCICDRCAGVPQGNPGMTFSINLYGDE